MPSYTIVLDTDGLYYVADQSRDDYVSPLGWRTLKEAQAELYMYERHEEPEDD